MTALLSTPPVGVELSNSPIAAFTNEQSKGPAVYRARKVLPDSIPRKLEVVSRIVRCVKSPQTQTLLRTDFQKTTGPKKKRSDALDSKVLAAVENFFKREGISRMHPDKRKFIKVKKSNGEAEQR